MAMSTGGLRRALQARLLDGMIRKVGSAEHRWKVLVVDREALRILSSALPVNELVNEGITIVEVLDMRREPLPRIPALYFITPSAESVQQLASESPTQYREFHLFFTSRLPDFQMDVIRANTDLLRRVRTLVELDVAFLALESRLFSLGRPASSLPQIHAEDSKNDRSEELSTVSERLAETCRLVAPDVDWTVRSDATSGSTKAVASLVKEQLESARDPASKQENRGDESNSDGEPLDEDDRVERATLLIVDRASDLVSPLVHEFSYQAMVHDLLKVDYRKPGGAHLEVPDDNNAEKTKSVQLDDEEKDPIWSSIRCAFIEEALKSAHASFKEFLETDAAFKIRGKGTGDVDIKDMSAAVRSLPESQMRADKHAMHIQAAKECLNICAEESLTDLALVEQDLILGRQSDGTKIRPEFMVESLTEILSDESIPVAHRVRLVLSALVVSEGLGGLGGETSALSSSVTFRAKLMRSGFESVANSEQTLASAMKGLERVLKTAKSGYHNYESKWKAHEEVEDTVTAKLKHKYANRQAYKQQKKDNAARRRRHGLQAEGELEYDVARYHPPLRSVMMDLIDEVLDKDAFPLTGSLSVDSIIAGVGASSVNERSQSERVGVHGKSALRHGAANIRAHSAQVADMVKTLGKSDSVHQEDDDRFRMAERGHLYVIFVLGGVCYSEVRAMHEVCEKREANVLIGGSSVLTPSSFLEALGAVADPVIRIRVMLPPLPIELALSRAARAKALEAGRAKQKAQTVAVGTTSHTAAVGGGEEEEERDNAQVEVVTGYKKKGAKRFFGRRKK